MAAPKQKPLEEIPKGKNKILDNLVIKLIFLLFPVLISLFALSFTAATYYASHRPFVGIIGKEIQFVPKDVNPPIGMSWSFTMKNTGNVPAIVTLRKNECRLTTNEKTKVLPVAKPIQGIILLMPNQTSGIEGHFLDSGGHAIVADVIGGRTSLIVEIDIAYEGIGLAWWLNWVRRNNFYYTAVLRFHHKYIPQTFIMESGTAN
jgi:hypothetical protein